MSVQSGFVCDDSYVTQCKGQAAVGGKGVSGAWHRGQQSSKGRRATLQQSVIRARAGKGHRLVTPFLLVVVTPARPGSEQAQNRSWSVKQSPPGVERPISAG